MRTIPFGCPVIGEGEKEAVRQVLDGTVLVHGPRVRTFETGFAELTGATHALATASCTASLHLSWFTLGLGPGDEVIVPAQTHVATAHAVELCGATCVFVDAEPHTGNIDVDAIESKITSRTRGISVVHFLGMPVDMTRVLDIARKHDLFVIEDCALAIGSTYKGVHVGLWGDTGCFSFYPVKQMTTVEGGMLITNDGSIAARISKQRAFGVDRHVGERAVPGVYDVPMLGFNYRMNEIEAAIGIEQLKRFDGFMKTRERNYRHLARGLREIDELRLFQSTTGDFKSSYYCLSAILEEPDAQGRADIIRSLNEMGIGTSVYYPKPVPLLSYYLQKYGYGLEEFPVASRISESSIAFPVGPHLDEADMEYIITAMKDTLVTVG